MNPFCIEMDTDLHGASLGIDNDRVGNAIGCYCIVDEESLKKGKRMRRGIVHAIK